MPGTPHRSRLAVAVGLVVVGACGGDAGRDGAADVDEGGVATVSDPTTAPEGIPIPDGATMFDTADTHCNGGEQGAADAAVEMAFVGTVRVVEPGDPAPWVTFDVEAWFTDDLGTEIALWAPDWDGAPTERWLVAASRYAVGPLASGEVFACASDVFGATAAAAWELRFGAPVVAGSGVPERPADPALLAEIDAAEARWVAAALHDYTFAVGVYDRAAPPRPSDSCGDGLVRVVVEDGRAVQARDVGRHCDVDLDDAPTITGLFELMRKVAGAVPSAPERGPAAPMFDPELGYPLEMSADDRSVEVSIWMEEFTPLATPVAIGPIDEVVDAARARWDAAAIRDYEATIEVRCFCDVPGPFTVTVRNGAVVSEVPESLDWIDPSVDGIFDFVASTRLDDDAAELAFDPVTGAPAALRFEGDLATIDDELDVFVRDLAPLP